MPDNTTTFGYNEIPVRLALLAAAARAALDRVALNDDDTMECWLAYGAANE
jgi:hypothetical protein